MSTFGQYFVLSAPLFGLVLLGYAIGSSARWKRSWSEWASKAVFNVVLPALLFRMMSQFGQLPPVDTRLLIAFFGGCIIVFAIGRSLAAHVFELDGTAQSVFGMGGIFSNNVLLGVPLASATLGPETLPAVALVLTFNSLILWTLVSVSVEWARHGASSMRGLGATALSVARNPIVASIVGGTLFGLTGLTLPLVLDCVLRLVGGTASPAALLVLGMGLAHYGFRNEWRAATTITLIKLLLHPAVVWLLAVALGLPALETSVVVLLASLSVGVNVYLMAAQFDTLQGAVAGSLVLSTAAAAMTTPIVLTLLGP